MRGGTDMSDGTRLDLFISSERSCNYLPERRARTVFVDPTLAMDPPLYSLLAAHGFRRSGPHVYRPQCEGCRACVPLRVPLGSFEPSRDQKRVLRRNLDVRVVARPAAFEPEHFALYERYLAGRHAGGGMDGGSEADYRQFLLSPWCRTVLLEMRRGDALVGVAVTDELERAFSAVYTFFDPSLSERGLGTYAILMQIEEGRRRGLDWLYLGYWVEASRKMSYKARFRPFETLGPEGWRTGGVESAQVE